VRFFFDNNMPPPLVRAIGELEKASEDPNMVVHLRDRFAPDTPDVTWIKALGAERDWVIVSADLRITRNPAERKAWKESGLTAFFLKPGWAEQRTWVYAAKLITWWPDITAQARMISRGTGFLVPIRGTKFENLVP
jgi:PIN like domain